MPQAAETTLAAAGADIVMYEDVFDDPDRLYRCVDTEADWRQEDITLFGRTHKMPRLVCWMGERPYTYSGLTHPAAPFSPAVATIRKAAERIAGSRFNGVLLNLYRDGRDSMGWHADDEASLGAAPVIASVSLGAVRRMRFKPKPHFKAETFGVDLPPGSLLLMKGATQTNWLHAIPKTAKPVGPRINLTFRMIV
ncbi:MAG: alpha-ketoglutarate-dependent dioxygenase AlkB [Rhodospirillales bacterium]|nr:alpha-ketoglutarate-dependent dioxygenase AlkB [Rhodospirillales bacterium]MBO6785451.1 alpha-ketoglutarate-dependent dioxygenase AlkB [Rhodospirillales bacterium]